MKAFWWYKENAIAGMARPGFNGANWAVLPYEEAVVLGWIGLHQNGTGHLNHFNDHFNNYGIKIQKFYGVDESHTEKYREVFSTSSGFAKILESLNKKTELLEKFDISEDSVKLHFNLKNLNKEIDFIKSKGVKRIVCLTEVHHNNDVLAGHFDLKHFPINDLEAPKDEQVFRLAEFIKSSERDRKPLAIHCLAGIGRTSTMIISAHLAMGESLEHLKERISKTNPSFMLTGSQAEFVHAFAERVRWVLKSKS